MKLTLCSSTVPTLSNLNLAVGLGLVGWGMPKTLYCLFFIWYVSCSIYTILKIWYIFPFQFAFVSNLRKTQRVRTPITSHESELTTNGNTRPGAGWQVWPTPPGSQSLSEDEPWPEETRVSWISHQYTINWLCYSRRCLTNWEMIIWEVHNIRRWYMALNLPYGV